MNTTTWLVLLAACGGGTGADSGGPAAGGSLVTDPSATPTGPVRVVLQGQVIEIAVPEDPWIAERLVGTPYTAPGELLTLYYSLADSADELTDGLLPGLEPQMWRSDYYNWWFQPSDDGSYILAPALRGALDYDEHTTLEILSGVIEGREGAATVYLPTYATVGAPEVLALGAGLSFDFANQGFASGVAVVIDADGAVTWANSPETVDEMYSANATTMTSLEIPATAFPRAGAFVVGFAAATRTFASDLRDLHPELSAVRAGRMAFWRVDVAAE